MALESCRRTCVFKTWPGNFYIGSFGITAEGIWGSQGFFVCLVVVCLFLDSAGDVGDFAGSCGRFSPLQMSAAC